MDLCGQIFIEPLFCNIALFFLLLLMIMAIYYYYYCEIAN